MRHLTQFIGLSILLLFFNIGLSQEAVVDSMRTLYVNTSDEGEKADLAIRISKALNGVDNERSIFYAGKALEHARRCGDDLRVAKAHEAQAAIAGTNGNTTQALELYFESFSIYKEMKDQKEIAQITNNIANIYLSIDDLDRAEDYFTQSYDAGILAADSNAIAVPLIGLAILYERDGDVQKALDATLEAIPLFEGIDRKDAMVVSYVNAATYYEQLGNLDQAYEYMAKGKEVNKILLNKYYTGSILINESKWKATEGKYDQAIAMGEEGIQNFLDINASRDVISALESLSEIYALAGKHETAYEYLIQYISLQDSVDNANKTVIVEEMTAKFDKAEDEKLIAELNHKTDLQALENKKNQTITYTAIVGAAVLLILVVLAFIAYHQKKKSAVTLRQKNTIIEEKNREILDSILYAKRIQDAIIPSGDIINMHLKESFVLYKPKDIVAGDFYWMETVGDSILLAVADCTGHGVPGAMVSVVCNNALNRSVREFKLTSPEQILDKTRELVVETFANSEEEVKDGMDISLCSWDKKTNKIEWAGANNPLYILKKDAKEVEIINPDKQPVGQYAFSSTYTKHSLTLNEGDSIYLFSDGFMDQFGGAEGKKYKYARFRKFLETNFSLPMSEQKQLLTTEFEKWKGDLEQLDDICIIGIRV